MITLYYAAFLTFIYIALAIYIVALRRKYQISLGTGNGKKKHADLEAAVRMHGNFNENVPLFLVLMILLELNAAPLLILHLLCISMIIGRFAHIYALKNDIIKARQIGMILTWGSLILAAVVAIILWLPNL